MFRRLGTTVLPTALFAEWKRFQIDTVRLHGWRYLRVERAHLQEMLGTSKRDTSPLGANNSVVSELRYLKSISIWCAKVICM